MRVPFRSREQRRGKHSEGSETDYAGDAHGYADRGLPGSAELGEISGPQPSPVVDHEGDEISQGTQGTHTIEEWQIEPSVPDTPREAEMAQVSDIGQASDADPAPEMAEQSRATAMDSDTAPSSDIQEDPGGAIDDPDTARSSASAPVDSLQVTAALSENGAGGVLREALGSVIKTEDPDEKVDSGREKRPSTKLPRIVAVANQKGGVGKTTTAVNLGAGLAELGFRVLVIDLDPQGNATTGLGIEARHFENSMYDVIMKDIALEDCIEPTSLKNLFVAPATIDLAGAEIELVPAFSREFKLRKAIQTVVDDFDYVLIDCPPSLGLITINGLAAAGEVLVPIQCEYYALEGLGQLLRNVQLVQSNLNEKLEVSTIVLTMYDARTKLSEQVASEVRAHFGPRVCRVVIPRTVRISEAPSFGQPITVFDPTSRGAIAYRELAKEVSGVET